MRRHILWLIPSALLAAAIAFLLLTYITNPFGLGDDEGFSRALTATSSVGGGYLYVQTAEGGTLRGLGNGTYSLELTGVAARSTYFSDRPARDAGTDDPADMISSLWEPDLAPPNAALVATGADGVRVTVPLELTNPSYDASVGTMRFVATPLDAIPDGLIGLELERVGTAPETFTEADLFIDTSFNICYLKVVNYSVVRFVLESKDPDDADRWGPSSPPSVLTSNGTTSVTIKYKYRSDSARKSGQLVYQDANNAYRKLTLSWTCAGDIEGHFVRLGCSQDNASPTAYQCDPSLDTALMARFTIWTPANGELPPGAIGANINPDPSGDPAARLAPPEWPPAPPRTLRATGSARHSVRSRQVSGYQLAGRQG
ncbi:MAG: hypothetical protein AB7U23_06390 [Dehalococcoidia bacterium]